MITHHMQVGFTAGVLAPVLGPETPQANIVSAAIGPFSGKSEPIRAGSGALFGDILQAAEGELVLAQSAAFAPPVQTMQKRGFGLPESDATDSLPIDTLEIALPQPPVVAVMPPLFAPPVFAPPQGETSPVLALADGSAAPIHPELGKAAAAPQASVSFADLPLADLPAINLPSQNAISGIDTVMPQSGAEPRLTETAARSPFAPLEAEFTLQTAPIMADGGKLAAQNLPHTGGAATASTVSPNPPNLAQTATVLDLPHLGSNIDQGAPIQSLAPQPNTVFVAQQQPSLSQMAVLAAGYQELPNPQDAARRDARAAPMGLENDSPAAPQAAVPQAAAIMAPTVAALPANTILMQNVITMARLNQLEGGQTALPDDLLPAFGPESARPGGHVPILSAPQAAAQTGTLQAALSAQILARAPAAQTGTIEFTLSPIELGQLRFEMRQTGEAVQILLSAERPETLDLLRKNSDSLLNDFRMAGFSGASLSFGGWGGAGQGAQPMTDDTARSGAAPPQIAPPDTPLPRAIQGAAAGLNLRL